MSLIPRMPAEPERDALSVRVPTSVIEELREYSTFVRGSKDYVITAALERLFKQDREFIKWKQTQTPSAPDSSQSRPSPPAARTAATALCLTRSPPRKGKFATPVRVIPVRAMKTWQGQPGTGPAPCTGLPR